MLIKKITNPLYINCCKPGALLCLLMLTFFNVAAQFNLTIKLQSVPSVFSNQQVFIAGTFNNWNPDLQQFSLENGILTTTIKDVGAGRHEFKFTRGSWRNVECDAKGKNINNRVVHINSDTIIFYTIEGWIDDEAGIAGHHTASNNVELMDEVFEMPRLNKHRRIWIYLPPGYNKDKKRYPVLYMHDGQNVFDEYTAPFGEWGVDESLDSLTTLGKPACIVVAIENGQEERMSEYNPFEFTWKQDSNAVTFSPKGDEYIKDIIETLKPFIDKKYRTLSSKEHTIIAGSSMGGLISYYACIKYPHVFGKAGIFSPAFWTAKGIDSLTDAFGGTMKGKYFFYMGGKEGGTYLDDMKRIIGKVGKNSAALIYSVIDAEAEHNERYWRKWFPEFYTWIMADGFNVNTSPE